MSLKLNNSINIRPHAQTSFKGIIKQKVAKSAVESLNWYSKAAVNSSVVCNSTTALIVASIMRPPAIMICPGAKKDDKKYAIAKSIASGIIGFVTSWTLYKPLETAFKSIENKIEKNKLKLPIDKKGLKFLNFALNKGSYFIIAPIISMVLISSIKPIVRKLFPKKEINKQQQVELHPPAQTLNKNASAVKNFLQKNGGIRNV